MRVGLLDGRILPLLVLLDLFVSYYLYVGMAFQRTERPPRHGVSAHGTAAEAWRFSARNGRRGMAFQRAPRGWLSRASPSPGWNFWIAARDSPRRLPPRPRRRLDRQRRCFVRRLACTAPARRASPARHPSHAVTAGTFGAREPPAPTVFTFRAARQPGSARRAAPGGKWRRPASPYHHPLPRPAPSLSRLYEPGLRFALPPRAATGGFQSRERPRP